MLDVSDSALMERRGKKHRTSGQKLQLTGDTRSLGTDAFFQMAMGEELATRFLAHETASNRKLTPERASQLYDSTRTVLKNHPGNLRALSLHAYAAYETGDDAEAGKTYAKLKLAAQKAGEYKSLLKFGLPEIKSTAFQQAMHQELKELEPRFRALEKAEKTPLVQPPQVAHFAEHPPKAARLATASESITLKHPAQTEAKSRRESSPMHDVFAPLIKAWEDLFEPDKPAKPPAHNPPIHRPVPHAKQSSPER